MAFTVNKKAFCVLEFAKTESIVTVQRRFRIMYHTEPPTDKTISRIVKQSLNKITQLQRPLGSRVLDSTLHNALDTHFSVLV